MTFILIFLIVFCGFMAIGFLSNAKKWETETMSVAKNKKIGAFLAVTTIILIIISVIVFNSNSSDYEHDNTPTYNNQTHQSHECYVCGKDASLKYGSHYYCNTHWAMVKTIDEAD